MGPSRQIGTQPCCRQHFSTLDSYTIASRDPAGGRKKKTEGQKTEEEVEEGGGPGTYKREKGGREEFGRWEAIHRGYKEPMSTGVEGQKTELALERGAQFTHVTRLGRRGGQAYKCTGEDNTHTYMHNPRTF